MKNLSTKKVIVSSILALVLGLVFYNTKDLVLGSPLFVSSLKDGSLIKDSYLPISGKAKHAASLHINGRPINISKDGSFSDSALLSPGYNIVEISSKDRFGKEKKKVLHLVASPSKEVATSSITLLVKK